MQNVSYARAVERGIVSGFGTFSNFLAQHVVIYSISVSRVVIEIMACPGGCINGGGQPYLHGHYENLEKRANALYTEDRNKTIRKSHENPAIMKLYEEFLDQPGSEIAHELLHTHYSSKVASFSEKE